MCAALVEASPLGENNDDVILKAIVLVCIRHHWIEKNPFAGTELPAWGPPACPEAPGLFGEPSLHLATSVSFYTILVRCCYSMLRSVDTWTNASP